MPRVHVSQRLLPRVLGELEASFDLDLRDSTDPPTRDELLSASAGQDGLLVTPTERVDAELLDVAGGSLKIVANHAVGYDNVDLEAATRRNVLVTNTPDVLTRATAEFTIALVLSLLRRVTEGDRLLRAQKPWVLGPMFMLGTGLSGLVLGIVGLGRIGAEVARLAGAFGMKIVYTGRSGRRAGIPYEPLTLGELLQRADVVSLHCPFTPETHHLIGVDELRQMRRDAVLVNTARGPVVDEDALVEALQSGKIAGAALDVFEREPAVPRALLELNNVVLAPHIASATYETREAMGMLCVSALKAVLLEGRCPANALNPKASQ